MQRNSYKNYGFKLSKPLFTKYVKLLYLCGAIFVLKRRITKMAPQGATLRCKYTKHISDNSVLTVPLKLSDILNCNVLKTLSVCNEM